MCMGFRFLIWFLALDRNYIRVSSLVLYCFGGDEAEIVELLTQRTLNLNEFSNPEDWPAPRLNHSYSFAY